MSSHETFAETPSATRRSVLKAATATIVLSGLPWAARAATPEAAGNFAVLSRYLTGKASLDAEVQAALYQAFVSLDDSFPQKIGQLRQLIEADGVTADGLNAHLAQTAPELASLPQEILTGWYLGVAGAGKEAICVTYANDLSNAAVADVLAPKSYAYGPCNSWAEKPV